MEQQKQSHLPLLTVFAVLVLAPAFVFWPGLSGDFLFDDTANLSSLSRYGGIVDLNTFLVFIFDGVSSFLGRPISLATFVLNAQQWPADPYPFKVTNLTIHIFNTLVLFAVLHKLLAMMKAQGVTVLGVAAFGALLWAIHPMQTSTVLYVIQRMTELSATFVFLGLWCYLHGRSKLVTTPRAAYIWMSCAVVLGGVLSTLSKETGILLPLFILIIEATLLSHLPRPKQWNLWAIPFIALPMLIVIGYLGMVVINHSDHYANRDFGLIERVMTEGRIVLHYVGYILFPSTTPSLLHDDISLSEGLFSPISTVVALFVIIFALISASLYRKQLPVISFAILWYLGGQLLESTVISLELYYEHRNYVPLVGPAFALAYCLGRLVNQKSTAQVVAVPLVLLVLLGTVTWRYSTTWGNNEALIATWYEEHPNSPRTALRHVIGLMQQGKVEESYAITSKLVRNYPDYMGSHVMHVTISCFAGRLTREEYDALATVVQSHYIDAAIFSRFTHLFKVVAGGYCRQMSPKGIANLAHILVKNPYITRNGEMSSQLYMMLGSLYWEMRQLQPALDAVNAAYDAKPSIDAVLTKTQLLMAAGEFDAAENALNIAIELDKNRNPLIPSRSSTFMNAQKMINDARGAAIQ